MKKKILIFLSVIILLNIICVGLFANVTIATIRSMINYVDFRSSPSHIATICGFCFLVILLALLITVIVVFLKADIKSLNATLKEKFAQGKQSRKTKKIEKLKSQLDELENTDKE